jgi:hypothetical protein
LQNLLNENLNPVAGHEVLGSDVAPAYGDLAEELVLCGHDLFPPVGWQKLHRIKLCGKPVAREYRLEAFGRIVDGAEAAIHKMTDKRGKPGKSGAPGRGGLPVRAREPELVLNPAQGLAVQGNGRHASVTDLSGESLARLGEDEIDGQLFRLFGIRKVPMQVGGRCGGAPVLHDPAPSSRPLSGILSLHDGQHFDYLFSFDFFMIGSFAP